MDPMGTKYVKILVVTGILDAWRIIPFTKWLITMVILSPHKDPVIPLPKGRNSWLK